MSERLCGKVVLLVDDQAICREMFTLVLERDGYDVRVARDGVHALEVLNTCSPDLIIVDDQMPRLDGVGFLERYNRSIHEKVPVILMTDDGEGESVVEASSLGVFDHIIKRRFAQAETRERIARFAGARRFVEIADAI